MSYVIFKDIHPDVVAMINKVVAVDEGDWVLNAVDKNDTDGGWTFGGITSSLFNSFYETDATKYRPITRETVAAAISTEYGRQSHIEDCIVIYYNAFVSPIISYTGDEECYDNQFSCAINLGMSVFRALWSNLIKDDPHQEFVERWREHYIHLVVENAKAWRDYAIDLEDQQVDPDRRKLLDTATLHFDKTKKPKSLRAIYLAGWLNRVARYA